MSDTKALRLALAQALAALATCNSNDGDDPWFDYEKVYAAREQARAALAATPQPAPAAVPAGWALVPVKPTPAMLKAGIGWGMCAATWGAMLAAAQQAPAAHERGEG